MIALEAPIVNTFFIKSSGFSLIEQGFFRPARRLYPVVDSLPDRPGKRAFTPPSSETRMLFDFQILQA